jgi:hypothetical protein
MSSSELAVETNLKFFFSSPLWAIAITWGRSCCADHFYPMSYFCFYLRFLNYYPKTCNFTICSIYRHGGHDGWSAGSSDISFKGNPLRMIQAKFGLNWPSGFRGEDFLKKFTDGPACQDLPTLQFWSKSEYPSLSYCPFFITF